MSDDPVSYFSKSTPEEIRVRFDADVERFSSLETGQAATMDAPLVLDLVTRAAAAATPGARTLLDVGCGAGNYTLKYLQANPGLERAILVDLSAPMLERARERIAAAAPALEIVTHQSDIRALVSEFAPESIDVILAAAVLHHLRGDEEWQSTFATFHRALRPGGGLWIADLVTHENPAIHAEMWRQYGDYLTGLKDEAYRDHVFAYIEKEDTPRPLEWQTRLLQSAGFCDPVILHKHAVFVAFGALKSEGLKQSS